jgi:dihydrofolate reductase
LIERGGRAEASLDVLPQFSASLLRREETRQPPSAQSLGERGQLVTGRLGGQIGRDRAILLAASDEPGNVVDPPLGGAEQGGPQGPVEDGQVAELAPRGVVLTGGIVLLDARSVAAVNSALQRARATLQDRLPGQRTEWTRSSGPSGEERELLRRYLDAHERADVDGVMQAPGGPDEDPTGGFELGGWGVTHMDEEMMGQVAESHAYELLLGRGTYEIFAAHWPYDEGPIADQLNSTRKHVASTTLEEVEWNNSSLITGDVSEYVAELKRQDGPEIQVHGSPGLIQTLLENDLIDEFRVWIFPVVLGTGKRLFGDGAHPAALKLVDSKVSKTGVTINTYQRAGEVNISSFEFDDPTEAELERRERLAAG